MKNTKKYELNPNWVTGFTDAEGCFTINVSKIKNFDKWQIRMCFQIDLHNKDLDLILQIKDFFNVGCIYAYKNYVRYRVQSRKEIINVIIPHFDKYLLLTEKQNDYNIFKNIILIQNSSIFNSTDVLEVLQLKEGLNWGLSINLKKEFPNLTIINRPTSRFIGTIDPYWFAGFFSGDGCFMIKWAKLNSYVNLKIQIGQHLKDKILINNLPNFLNCGYTYEHRNQKYISYNITKFEDIYSKIIPFFKEYPIIGKKSEDFLDFCLAADIIKKKMHLKKEGLDEIKFIKARMNK
jgi:hypothetical protein